MDFTIVYYVALTLYGKALHLHFYYLTLWTHCTCMYVCMYVYGGFQNCGTFRVLVICSCLSVSQNKQNGEIFFLTKAYYVLVMI